MTDFLLTDKQIQHFIINGFIQVKTDLPDLVHREIFRKTDGVFNKIRSRDEEWAYNPQNNVLPRVPELQQIIDTPQVKGALTSLLGNNYIMLPHRHCHPNYPEIEKPEERKLIMGMHKDGHAGGQKPRHRGPRWAILFYYPQECPDELGPTVIVPRSHYYQNLARHRDENPNLIVKKGDDGNYELPEHYIERTLLPLSGGFGTISIMHFDVGHSVITNLLKENRYGQKFVFMRTEEPVEPTWNNTSVHWQQPEVSGISDHEILWTYIWNWMRGNTDRFSSNKQQEPDFTLEELQTLLDSVSEKDRLAATNRLGFLRNEASPAVPQLVTMLRDESEAVRLNAAYSLAAIGKAAQPELDELLKKDKEFFELDPVTHISIAAHALGGMGAEGVDILVANLNAKDEHTRAWAAYGLGEIGTAASTALSALVGQLDDPSPHVRRHVLSAIGIIASDDDKVESVLAAELRKEPDGEIRQYVLQAMFRIGPSSSDSIEIINSSLEDKDPYVSAYAAEQLFRTGTDEAFRSLVPYLRSNRWFREEPMTTEKREERMRKFKEKVALRKKAPELKVTVGGG